MNDLVKYLFETTAFRVCPNNKPFWYTSGKIGPFYINTQFLYGSEKDATELLDFINENLTDKQGLPTKVFEKVKKQYDENSIYKYTIDEIVNEIKNKINLDEVDYISGGERRDWFFSNIIAYILKKPHITIWKDLSLAKSNYDFTVNEPIENLEGKKCLHIADLITTASSYTKRWAPAIENSNGKINWSISVVDRVQGGEEILNGIGIKSYSLIKLDGSLFDQALKLNVINDTQYQMLNEYKHNPDETMRKFLIDHPEFLEEALKSDAKTAARAKDCIENNLYNL